MCSGCLTAREEEWEGRQGRFGYKKQPKRGVSAEGGQETPGAQSEMWLGCGEHGRMGESRRIILGGSPRPSSTSTLENLSQPPHPSISEWV